MYNFIANEPDDTPRNTAAGVAGALSAGGPTLALIGAGAAFALQLSQAGKPSTAEFPKGRPIWSLEHVGDGLFDGFIAVLARALLIPH